MIDEKIPLNQLPCGKLRGNGPIETKADMLHGEIDLPKGIANAGENVIYT
jgi:hypothetical protein